MLFYKVKIRFFMVKKKFEVLFLNQRELIIFSIIFLFNRKDAKILRKERKEFAENTSSVALFIKKAL